MSATPLSAFPHLISEFLLKSLLTKGSTAPAPPRKKLLVPQPSFFCSQCLVPSCLHLPGISSCPHAPKWGTWTFRGANKSPGLSWAAPLCPVPWDSCNPTPTRKMLPALCFIKTVRLTVTKSELKRGMSGIRLSGLSKAFLFALQEAVSVRPAASGPLFSWGSPNLGRLKDSPTVFGDSC